MGLTEEGEGKERLKRGGRGPLGKRKRERSRVDARDKRPPLDRA
jgi:hypothetical protein